ncbi:PTS mannose transporter subunit IIAB [Latilactobacillus curvatus]|uniref:PTS mannose transporter subunit IIAB n=1 Tax=Latilactobacillus curvatus TaxID=28038 RepID=A0AAC9UPW5_LATCU|nr:PTS sugar transporter subunit IIA [Latilactobacillus curvatus]ASN60913.1 PTS mannose transporter subunit IIAB [Latilactobacillus curvatus]
MKFTKENVLLNQAADSKEALLRIIARYAKLQNIVESEEATYSAFLKRESESSTGLQDGFAIPHAKDETVKTPTVIFVKNKSGISWETFDDQPVQYVFALLVPKAEQGTVHIQMLSALATALMEDDFKDAIIKSTDVKELVTIISNEMTGVNQ